MGHMTGSIMLQYTPNGTDLSKQALKLLIKLVDERTQNPNYALLNTGASDSGLKRYTTSTLGPLVSSVAARGRVPWSIRALWQPPMKLRIREWMLYNVLTQNQIPLPH